MQRKPELMDRVAELIREIAGQAIVPRFRTLTQQEISEKTPGELVTIVDREVEAWLTQRLPALLPGSRVIGEEACSADPGLLDTIAEGRVWLVDPLDGTANFVAGRPCFAVMVALLEDGLPTAAWLHDPMTDLMHSAERGAGAYANQLRLRAPDHVVATHQLRGAVLTRYLPVALRESVGRRSSGIAEALPGLYCAGAEYPAIAHGTQDFAMFWRVLPWDHVPGALLLSEAGGKVARLDGQPYRVGPDAFGLLVARSAQCWQLARSALLD